MTATRLIAVALAAFASAACSEATTSPAVSSDGLEVLAAHESNNRATLSGMQAGNQITGTAIINYVAGQDGWRSTVNLDGILAPGTYTFYAVAPNGTTLRFVCSFTIAVEGDRQGCSADTDLLGFATAQVRDAGGNIVAGGTFERRGGTRSK
ncbi:MAG: hypothetical protein ABIS03_07455 [Gemmatimonadaceae bacterium]